MLSLAVRNSKKLIREKSASDNIRIGRFFTKKETARLLASTLHTAPRTSVYLLDPGAGTGILSAAAIEALCEKGGVREIFLTCYENNEMFLPMLANNLERIRKKARHDYHVKVRIDIREEDFLLAEYPEDWAFDYIIMSPPEEPCLNTEPAALRYRDIVSSGTIDLSYLFVRAASDLLAVGGQMVTLLPLTSATGVSLTHFRQRLFAMARPERICLFAKNAPGLPLRTQLGLSLVAGADKGNITISVSTDDGTEENTKVLPALPYDQIVDAADGSLLLVTSEDDLGLLEFMRRLPCSLDTFHLKVHTGLALESRYPELLREKPVDGAVPLIHPRHLRGGIVQFPLTGVKNQFIIPSIPSLCQPNKNMLLMKRVPAKSDKRRLVCSAYLAGSMTNKFISTHNKLNYIDVADPKQQMDPAFLFGLLAFLSSELVDRYIRLISKSSQVNATELASLPLPTANQLRTLGQKLMAIRVYKPEYCDRVVKDLFRTEKT